ncbi:MAG TPA: hypothetical protein VNT99_08255 [Methylomirabilota bacterium]|nr:hypothetical protein [Methylomirabilota bacterium]
MTLREVMARDTAAMEVQLPDTFTWNTVAYPCVANSLYRGTIVTVGPKEVEVKLSLQVRLAAMGGSVAAGGLGYPAAGQIISFEGVNRKVVAVREHAKVFAWLDVIDGSK